MPRKRRLSAYRCMWLFAMFDLPVDTPENRRNYTRFRSALLRDGFLMLQFSVYARFMPSDEAAQVHLKRARQALPPGGQVRLLAVTDHQFSRMEVYQGKRLRAAEANPDQFLLFSP